MNDICRVREINGTMPLAFTRTKGRDTFSINIASLINQHQMRVAEDAFGILHDVAGLKKGQKYFLSSDMLCYGKAGLFSPTYRKRAYILDFTINLFMPFIIIIANR